MSFPTRLKKRETPLPPALYPLRGVLHFARHARSMGGPILTSAIKASVFSLITIVPFVKYGFGPQTRFLSRLYLEFRPQDSNQWFFGPGMVVSAAILTVAESFAIIGQLSDYFIGSVRDRFFDAVLKERNGLPPATAKKQQDTPSKHVDVVDALKVAAQDVKNSIPSTVEEAKTKARHFLSPVNIMVMNAQNPDSWSLFFLKPAIYVLTLPLNLIPVVGPAAFISIQALSTGGQAHKRYFDLYKWSPSRRQRRIEAAFWQYHQFGVVATALEMIPFAGFVFSYTNQIG